MWVPASESHSIELVALSYFFSEPLPIRFVQKASGYADELMASGKFSDKKIVREANLHLSGAETLAHETEDIGFSYLNKANEEVVKLHRDLAYFSASEYGTWEAFTQEASGSIGPFVESALELTDIRSVKLEYSDRFVFEGEQSDADFSEILKVEGLGLPKEATSNGMPWHDRRGWFRILNEGPVLINSNLAVTDVVHKKRMSIPLKSVQILTVVETRFPKGVDDYVHLQELVETLHIISKDVLRSVITENAAKMVGL